MHGVSVTTFPTRGDVRTCSLGDQFRSVVPFYRSVLWYIKSDRSQRLVRSEMSGVVTNRPLITSRNEQQSMGLIIPLVTITFEKSPFGGRYGGWM